MTIPFLVDAVAVSCKFQLILLPGRRVKIFARVTIALRSFTRSRNCVTLSTSTMGALLAFPTLGLCYFRRSRCGTPQWHAASVRAGRMRCRQCNAPAADTGQGNAHDSRTVSAVCVSVHASKRTDKLARLSVFGALRLELAVMLRNAVLPHFRSPIKS